MKDDKPDEAPFVELVDLRSITRHSDKVETHVSVAESPWDGTRHTWIVCGESMLRKRASRGLGTVPEYTLGAYLTAGVTDFEHDSAHAFCLPLLGLHFDGIAMGRVWLGAVIDPRNGDDFRVPAPGYNPMEHEDAYECKDERCSAQPHIIVPEGCYQPPINQKLFRKLAGRQVQILFGTKYDKD
jgi:hypothetical protein